jgi:hypothetical protein
MLRLILQRALVVVCAAILGRGILFALDGLDVRAEQAIGNVLRHVASGITSSAAAWIGAGVFGLLVLALWEVVGVQARVESGVRWFRRRLRRTIPLTEATEIAYTELAGTAYSEMAASEAQRDDDNTSINRWFAWHIWNHVPIYGRRHPSKATDRIPREYQKRGDFIGNAAEFKLRGETTVYRDLCVRREDLDKYLSQIRETVADNPSLRT